MARYSKPGHKPVETTSAREAAALKANGYVEQKPRGAASATTKTAARDTAPQSGEGQSGDSKGSDK